LDRLDLFFIERGLPAEREIGERETRGGTVLLTELSVTLSFAQLAKEKV
jgi:hypothetical protein